MNLTEDAVEERTGPNSRMASLNFVCVVDERIQTWLLVSH